MGVSLKNIVHDTTMSAAELNGKTVGSGVTITGILTEQGYQLAVADAVRKSMLATAQQRLTAFKSANDNSLQSAASSISSPLSGVVGDARSRLESAQDAVKDAQKSLTDAAKSAKAEPMANASKTDPALDPYLSRNASVYYGTATEQFYKEISWQDASLNAANQALSVDQEALQTQQEALQTAQQELATAQAQYDQLQSIASSANRMAESKMDPNLIGDAIAAKLASAGFQATAQQMAEAARSFALAATEAKMEKTIAALSIPVMERTQPTMADRALFNATPGFSSAQPFAAPLQNTALLKPHATGGDLLLPGSGGEQPYVVSAQPGERLRISPRGQGGDGPSVNNTMNVEVHGVTDPSALLGRLGQLAGQMGPPGYSKAAMRAARLAA
jgi:hypothetical protein